MRPRSDPEHEELKDAQEFATWVPVDYQMLSTLVSFVVFGVIAPQSVLLWLRARRHGQLGTRRDGVCIWTRVFHRVGDKQMWYACSGKFSSSQVVTGFSKEIRRVKAENISAKLERTRVCRCLVFDSGRLRTFMRQSHSADWLFVLRQRDSCCRVFRFRLCV